MTQIYDLVQQLRSLPGVGEKTATRYAYDILEMPEATRLELINYIQKLDEIKLCQKCFGYTTFDICEYCQEKRNSNTLIVVAKPKDIDKIEKILPQEYYYFSLGGIIDPLNGVRIDELNIEELDERLKEENIEEIILVLPTNNEGELTSSYLRKRFNDYNVKFTKLAQGVPIGGELEYLDELTLLKSIQKRQDY